MRDPKRIKELLNELEKFWNEVPDWRLGQIVSNLSRDCGYGTDPFYIEDGEFLAKLKEYNQKIKEYNLQNSKK